MMQQVFTKYKFKYVYKYIASYTNIKNFIASYTNINWSNVDQILQSYMASLWTKT